MQKIPRATGIFTHPNIKNASNYILECIQELPVFDESKTKTQGLFD